MALFVSIPISRIHSFRSSAGLCSWIFFFQTCAVSSNSRLPRGFPSPSANRRLLSSFAAVCSGSRRYRKKAALRRTVSFFKKDSLPDTTYGIPSFLRQFSRSSPCRCVRYSTAISWKLRIFRSFSSDVRWASSIPIPPAMRPISFATAMASAISPPVFNIRTGTPSFWFG